jgi:ribonuclease HII
VPKRPQLRGYDLRQLAGHTGLIGVDEAGRGALAGPVVAAAVHLTREFLESRWAAHNATRINDSKQLTAPEREALSFEFETLAAENAIHISPGAADVAEIEQHNILGATKLAMRRALEGLYPPEAFVHVEEPDLFSTPGHHAAWNRQATSRILIDGLPLKNFPYPHTGVIKGDARSLAIAMASIIAKVTRDRHMTALDATHPGYGFAQHKGYGTEEHREALLHLGRSPQHREHFLRKLLAGRVDPSQMDMGFGIPDSRFPIRRSRAGPANETAAPSIENRESKIENPE